MINIKRKIILTILMLLCINLFACSGETKVAKSATPRKQNQSSQQESSNDTNQENKVVDPNFKLTNIVYGDEEGKTKRQNQIYNDMSNKKWVYGRTPVEWVFVEANKQIVSNYKPNGSKKYAITENASSGERGCFLPILSGTENYGESYEGRFLCFDDTTKDPENLPFTNEITEMMYDGKKIKDILGKVMNVNLTQFGIIRTNEGLLNVIYATDLDEIIKKYY